MPKKTIELFLPVLLDSIRKKRKKGQYDIIYLGNGSFSKYVYFSRVAYAKCLITIENNADISYSLLSETLYSLPDESSESVLKLSSENAPETIPLNTYLERCTAHFNACPLLESCEHVTLNFDFDADKGGDTYYSFGIRILTDLKPILMEEGFLSATLQRFLPLLDKKYSLKTIAGFENLYIGFNRNKHNHDFSLIIFNALFDHLHNAPIKDFIFVCSLINYYGVLLNKNDLDIIKQLFLFRLHLKISLMANTLVVAEKEEDGRNNELALKQLKYLFSCLSSVCKKWNAESFIISNLASKLKEFHSIKRGHAVFTIGDNLDDKFIVAAFIQFTCFSLAENSDDKYSFLRWLSNDNEYRQMLLKKIQEVIADFTCNHDRMIEALTILPTDVSSNLQRFNDAVEEMIGMEEESKFGVYPQYNVNGVSVNFPLPFRSGLKESIEFLLKWKTPPFSITIEPGIVTYLRRQGVTSLNTLNGHHFIVKLIRKYCLTPEELTAEENYSIAFIKAFETPLINTEKMIDSLLKITNYLNDFSFDDDQERELFDFITPALYFNLFAKSKFNFSSLAKDLSSFLPFLEKYCTDFFRSPANILQYTFCDSIVASVSTVINDLPVNKIKPYLTKLIPELANRSEGFDFRSASLLSLLARFDYQQLYNLYRLQNIEKEGAIQNIIDILNTISLMITRDFYNRSTLLNELIKAIFVRTDFRFALENLYSPLLNSYETNPETFFIFDCQNFVRKDEYNLSDLKWPAKFSFQKARSTTFSDNVFLQKTNAFFEVFLYLSDHNKLSPKKLLHTMNNVENRSAEMVKNMIELSLRAFSVRTIPALLDKITSQSIFPKLSPHLRGFLPDEVFFQLFFSAPPEHPFHVNFMSDYLERPDLLLAEDYSTFLKKFSFLFEKPIYQLIYQDIQRVFANFNFAEPSINNEWLARFPILILRKIEKILLKEAFSRWLLPHNKIQEEQAAAILGVLEHYFSLDTNPEDDRKNSFISSGELASFIFNLYAGLQLHATDMQRKMQAAEEVIDKNEPVNLSFIEDQEMIVEDHTWYTYDGVEDPGIYPILSHYVDEYNANEENVNKQAFVTPLPLVVDSHNTKKDLEDHMRATILEIRRRNPAISRIMYPVSVHTNHWCLLIIDLNAEQRITHLSYFDPQANAIDKRLEIASINLLKIFAVNKSMKIHFYNQQLQRDYNGWDCGPWVVETARHLLNHGELPDPYHDIQGARNEHRAINNHLPALGKRKRESNASGSGLKRQCTFFSSSLEPFSELFSADVLEKQIRFTQAGKNYFTGVSFKLKGLLEAITQMELMIIRTQTDGSRHLRLRLLLNREDKEGEKCETKKSNYKGEFYNQMVINEPENKIELRITLEHLMGLRFEPSRQGPRNALGPILTRFFNTFAKANIIFNQANEEIAEEEQTAEVINTIVEEAQRNLQNEIARVMTPYTSLNKKEAMEVDEEIEESEEEAEEENEEMLSDSSSLNSSR